MAAGAAGPVRRFGILLMMAMVTCGVATLVATMTHARGGAGDDLDAEVDQAVARAIDFLVEQQRDNGAICDTYPRNATAMTSLSLLAMAAVGHQPTDVTAEGQAMRRALDYVLQEEMQDEEGYYGSADGSRMYGHGITTLMLAEMLGMGINAEQDQLIRRRLTDAVDLILTSQQSRKSNERFEGGWRYLPNARDADLSVTVWQVMALRSAQNAGVEVPGEAIDRAVEYLERSFVDRGGNEGGFTYQPNQGLQRRHVTTTSMGLLSLQVCAQYDAPEIPAAVAWLEANPPEWGNRWILYGLYYYAQGMYQYAEGLRLEGDIEAGDRHEAESMKRVAELLLPNQKGDGAWESRDGSERNAGEVYMTSMAVLCLSVKYHLLPIYQR